VPPSFLLLLERIHWHNTITHIAVRGYNFVMLCDEGQKLKDILADASIRFSDFPAADVKQMPMPDRLEAERLHFEQQEALSAFTRHVETCLVCGQNYKVQKHFFLER
jgi:hypothetical protein